MQVQHETGQHWFARRAWRIVENLHLKARLINLELVSRWIGQPAWQLSGQAGLKTGWNRVDSGLSCHALPTVNTSGNHRRVVTGVGHGPGTARLRPGRYPSLDQSFPGDGTVGCD